MKPSLLAISSMVALVYNTRHSGTDTVLGLGLTGTGALLPFFGTLLGRLSVALTGTDGDRPPAGARDRMAGMISLPTHG